MGRRQHPWVLSAVPWSPDTQYIRGTCEGVPLLSWGTADRARLATYRQLRRRGLRPGGQDPVAVLYFRHNASKHQVKANLYRIDLAKPVRPMTPARWTALAKANLARRICHSCGRDVGYVVPTSTRQCWPCFEADDIAQHAA
ncbi:RRQRL motif-containing zinc-binding protein [Umezawaea beigongshangensis]|uniref:RRQRL motif-containing zinc-binding protein n=1 Tax=Umezawaea beigongshangensis TaxID=2780383 RepID=UPI0018F169E5|nr:RRQRL motif-containing zinc-binding protein [Umezawaea beigongshangensis]